MVERIVLVKLADEHTHDEARRAIAVHSVEALQAVPGVVAVWAGVPADPASAGSWDLQISVRFASIDDVEPYRVHPLHLAYREYLDARMTFIKAWNFERLEG